LFCIFKNHTLHDASVRDDADRTFTAITKYSRLQTDQHKLVVGAELASNRRNEIASALQNGGSPLRLVQSVAAAGPQFVRNVSAAAVMHTPVCCTISMGWRPDSSEGAGRNPNQEMLK